MSISNYVPRSHRLGVICSFRLVSMVTTKVTSLMVSGSHTIGLILLKFNTKQVYTTLKDPIKFRNNILITSAFIDRTSLFDKSAMTAILFVGI